jgi:putative transposase
MSAVVLRLAYLALTNGFAMLGLLPMSDRAKDVEILALRHQITVLERQLHGQGHKVRLAPADRAFLAALLHRLPRHVLDRMRLLVRPETVLRWHRDLIAARHARNSRPKRVGRPRTVRSIRLLVLRRSRQNGTWGYRRHPRRAPCPRYQGRRLHCVGDPQRRRHRPGTATRQPDLGGVPTFASRGHPRRRLLRNGDVDRQTDVRPRDHRARHPDAYGSSASPPIRPRTGSRKPCATSPWTLHNAGSRARFLIRDRDGKYPAMFDTILADTGIGVVLSGVRMPRMNSIMERWIGTYRRELLDRTLIWNQTHLLRALRQYERHYNEHRPHRGISNSRPLQTLPEPITDPATITHLHIRRRDRLGGILHEYEHAT